MLYSSFDCRMTLCGDLQINFSLSSSALTKKGLVLCNSSLAVVFIERSVFKCVISCNVGSMCRVKELWLTLSSVVYVLSAITLFWVQLSVFMTPFLQDLLQNKLRLNQFLLKYNHIMQWSILRWIKSDYCPISESSCEPSTNTPLFSARSSWIKPTLSCRWGWKFN